MYESQVAYMSVDKGIVIVQKRNRILAPDLVGRLFRHWQKHNLKRKACEMVAKSVREIFVMGK